MGINDFIQVGSNIKKLRKERGISQKKMAELLNLPVSTYSNYENNYREPSSNTIVNIADILNVPVTDIINKKMQTAYYEEYIRNSEIYLKPVYDAIRNNPNISADEIVEMTINESEKYLGPTKKQNLNSINQEKNKLLNYYNTLNNSGRQKAVEQVELLTKIPEYTNKDTDQ